MPSLQNLFVGSPPRMRGKAMRTVQRWTPGRDHPRACGEKVTPSRMLVGMSGSPPRMRGKENATGRKVRCTRITPAHAGKRILADVRAVQPGDHPRACGEKFASVLVDRCKPGSPPRMRGKVQNVPAEGALGGITPAHAGKSRQRYAPERQSQDHPRACGEKKGRMEMTLSKRGSPPRMRGKVNHPGEYPILLGITPAHAGKRNRLNLQPPAG